MKKILLVRAYTDEEKSAWVDFYIRISQMDGKTWYEAHLHDPLLSAGDMEAFVHYENWKNDRLSEFADKIFDDFITNIWRVNLSFDIRDKMRLYYLDQVAVVFDLKYNLEVNYDNTMFY